MGVLDGKVAIVTGSGRGIGKGMATALAKAGAAVTLTDIHKENLDNTVKGLLEQGLKVQGVVADGREQSAVKNAVKQTGDKFGPVYLLINCAQASTPNTPLADMTRDDFDLAMESGFYASWRYMQECYSALQQTQGMVVNFGSDAGITCNADQLPYNAAKEAIRALTRTAAREWAKDNITVNCIIPGMETEGSKQFFKEHPGWAEMRLKQIPLERFGKPEEECGAFMVFLATPGAKYFTGQTFSINGGINMRP